MEADLLTAAKRLRDADALLITAGAGMGVDSGLPDFRGPQGFWKAYPAIAKLGLHFEEMANPMWFDRDPHLAWAFYGHRLNLYRATQPHSGFAQLLQLAQSKKLGYFAFTSNVDGHFQKAGFEPARVVEVHGSIHHLQCVNRCPTETWPAPAVQIQIDPEKFRALDPLPHCPRCSALARPNILMFGDARWISSPSYRQEKALNQWIDTLPPASLAIIELGAGTSIPTVRDFSERTASDKKALLIRINPREPETPPGHHGLRCGALEGIQKLSQSAHTSRKTTSSTIN